ncbi:MAG: Teneurin-3 [Edaphobacter sp.]|nr:Teneurin-3 [Edaphobacter sp.]
MPALNAGTKPARSRAKAKLRIAALVLLAVSCKVLVGFVEGYIFEVLDEARGEAYSKAAYHNGPIAEVNELTGNGRIYLVQIGPHSAAYGLDGLAEWLRSKYGLQVQVLPPMQLDQSAWDSGRKQYVAELLYEQIKREHSELAADPNAYLFGFTDATMCSVNNSWASTFTQRDFQRMAVVSSHGIQDYWWQRLLGEAKISNEHVQARVRRILLKDVAILYWHLPLNNDPTSVLQNMLDTDIPAEDIFESDLDPARTRGGRPQGEPCVFFSYSAKDGIHELPGTLIRTCSDRNLPEHDTSVELIEVDLRFGLFIDKHTDFNLPDAVPIEFQRTTRYGWSSSNAFGISGTHNYDEFLSSKDNVRVSIIHADGGLDELVRVPRWGVPLAFAKYVDTGYSGRFYEMRWHAGPFEHYDLKRFDGEVKTFLPCAGSAFCYLTGYRNRRGEELKFDRDGSRRLTRLTSPNKSWLHLSYETGGRVAAIDDSKGRTVRYGYDGRGQLVSVTYPSGEIYIYTYDGAQHLLTFSVAQNAGAVPRLLLTNEYTDGMIARQTLADGATYTYSYHRAKDSSIDAASVRTSDGRIFDLRVFGGGSSIVRERDARVNRPDGKRAAVDGSSRNVYCEACRASTTIINVPGFGAGLPDGPVSNSAVGR